jgi:hypothetical protein
VTRIWRSLLPVITFSMLPEPAEKGTAVTGHTNASVSSCRSLISKDFR